jgi:hypothetical protein
VVQVRTADNDRKAAAVGAGTVPGLEDEHAGPGQAAHDALRDLRGGVAGVEVVHRDQLVALLQCVGAMCGTVKKAQYTGAFMT